MSTEKYRGVISTEENTWFIYQSSLAIIAAESSISKSGGTVEENY
jgi:hypothetical protein